MKRTILVLEDDIDMREMLVAALGKNPDYEVHPAALPSWALAMAEKTRFDLVVADVRMDEMDGIECVRRLRARQPSLRCIIITAHAGDDAPARAIKVAAEDYLYKPFKLARLTRSVAGVLGRDQERRLYDRLRETVQRGLKLFAPRPEQPAGPPPDLERSRDRTFLAYYVAVNANLLAPGDAMAFWDRLEQLELSLEAVKSGADPREMASLAEGYEYLHEFLVAVNTAGQRLHSGTRRPDALDEREFKKLFRRIKNGEISSEQLKLAFMLRTLTPEAREGQLGQLYKAVWVAEPGA